ncbi:hypothetical protein B0H66DRAFT_608838 [Apodospora peruviana]|uniref:Uncharacterized protein n=1 Tax=Apodospora peruviana TaxID=516989 RepID=A0AAE0HTF2_9PEZI|nr:hypothetical protein B0H66DRAFT_608838 [Apodospora peruviana]
MKFSSILSIIGLAATGIMAAPSAAPAPGAEVANLEVRSPSGDVDLASPQGLTARQSPQNLQAWLFSATCSPGPNFDYQWVSTSFTTTANPSAACHEFYIGSNRQDMYSLFLTGSWPSTCRLRVYANPGCTGTSSSFLPNLCAQRGGSSIKSANVVC